MFNQLTVSACAGAFDRATRAVNLCEWLETVRPERPRSDYDKKQLPAIMPHGVFGARKQSTFENHTGLVQVDIDAKHQRPGFDVDATLKKMRYNASVLACGKSCSGRGIYAFYLVDGVNAENHSKAAAALLDKVRQLYNVITDDAVSKNLSSLRFASPYPPFINECAEPWKLKF